MTNKKKGTFPSDVASREPLGGSFDLFLKHFLPHREQHFFTLAASVMRTYLRCATKNRQELVNALESVVAVQAVKDQADQACVVQRAGCQCQLSDLRSAQNVQLIKLQGTKSTTTFVETTRFHKNGHGNRLHSAAGHSRLQIPR